METPETKGCLPVWDFFFRTKRKGYELIYDTRGKNSVVSYTNVFPAGNLFGWKLPGVSIGRGFGALTWFKLGRYPICRRT